MCSETMILKQEEQSISSEETHITLGEGFSPKWKWELFLIFQGLGCGSAVKCLVFVRPGFNPRHLHTIKKKIRIFQMCQHWTKTESFSVWTTWIYMVSWVWLGFSLSTSQGRNNKVVQRGYPKEKQSFLHDGSNTVTGLESSNLACSNPQGHLYF